MASPDHVATLASLHRIRPRQHRATIPAQVRDILHRLILTGKMQTGERIVERQLARELGVGTPTIREALHALEDEGLVVRHARQGCFVATLSEKECHQIYRMRTVLEVLAAEMAVERRAHWKPEALLAALAELKKAAQKNDVERFFQSDLQLHLNLWRLSGSAFLIKALTQITVPLFAFTSIRMYKKNIVDLNVSASAHERVVAAVISGSSRNAKRATQWALEGFWHNEQAVLAETGNTVFTGKRRGLRILKKPEGEVL